MPNSPTVVRRRQKRIVAEVSRGWSAADGKVEPTIAQLFEKVIDVNLERGFYLESWTFQSAPMPDQLIETIIAVFTDA